MSDRKYSLERRQMLHRAQTVVDEASLGYREMLTQHIEDLKRALDNEVNLVDAIGTCYLIHTQAGTFGWSLATEVSGWFRRLLQKQQANGSDKMVNSLFLESLSCIVTEELKADSDAAIALLLHIETRLKKQDGP